MRRNLVSSHSIIVVSVILTGGYYLGHAQTSPAPCPSVTQASQGGTTLAPMTSAAISVQAVDSSAGQFGDNTSSNDQVGAIQTAINNITAAISGANLTATTENTDAMPQAPTTTSAQNAAVSAPTVAFVFASDSTFANIPGCNGTLPNGNPPDACTVPQPNGAGSIYYSVTYLRASTFLNASPSVLEPLVEHELGIATQGEADCVSSASNDCSQSIANPVNTNTAPTPCDVSRIKQEEPAPCKTSELHQLIKPLPKFSIVRSSMNS
jgi:hypothetical protein